MTIDPARVPPILLGTTPEQAPRVLEVALTFAGRTGATVVCAHVEGAAYVVEEHPDGSVESRPLDPDRPDWNNASFDADLEARIKTAAKSAGVQVKLQNLAGDVADALLRLADVVGAEMIVVGGRRGGVEASVHDFFGGSVAAHLIHGQPRPVVVVPVDPPRVVADARTTNAGAVRPVSD